MSHIENMEKTQECLASAIEKDFANGVEGVCTEEMAQATDMLKDISEALYYAKITKAMKDSEEEENLMDKLGVPDEERRFYNGNRYSNGRYATSGYRGTRRGYDDTYMYGYGRPNHTVYDPTRDLDRDMGRMYYTDGSSGYMGGSNGSRSMSSNGGRYGYDDQMMRDRYESRYDRARRGYEESKAIHSGNTQEDKQAKMKELEKYMSELSDDMTEMINGASTDEKNVLRTKLQNLVTKI